MSYNYSSFDKKKKKSKIFVYLLFFLILCFIVFSVVYFFYFHTKRSYEIKTDKIEIEKKYSELFHQKDYLTLIKEMDSELKNEPFKVNFLIYRGYSFFLLGEDEQDTEKQKMYFHRALFDLRKALSLDVPEYNVANVKFCIGKIYYYLGRDYYLFSIKYLNESLDYGNERVDLLYTLGIVYSYIGEYERAIEVFKKSLLIKKSQLTFLAIGINFMKMNDNINARYYFNQLLTFASDSKILEEANFYLGQINYEEKKYNDALNNFENVIQINENNALAFFYIGEVYYELNNSIKARANWRMTLAIDPNHIRALKRLY